MDEGRSSSSGAAVGVSADRWLVRLIGSDQAPTTLDQFADWLNDSPDHVTAFDESCRTLARIEQVLSVAGLVDPRQG